MLEAESRHRWLPILSGVAICALAVTGTLIFVKRRQAAELAAHRRAAHARAVARVDQYKKAVSKLTGMIALEWTTAEAQPPGADRDADYGYARKDAQELNLVLRAQEPVPSQVRLLHEQIKEAMTNVISFVEIRERAQRVAIRGVFTGGPTMIDDETRTTGQGAKERADELLPGLLASLDAIRV